MSVWCVIIKDDDAVVHFLHQQKQIHIPIHIHTHRLPPSLVVLFFLLLPPFSFFLLPFPSTTTIFHTVDVSCVVLRIGENGDSSNNKQQQINLLLLTQVCECCKQLPLSLSIVMWRTNLNWLPTNTHIRVHVCVGNNSYLLFILTHNTHLSLLSPPPNQPIILCMRLRANEISSPPPPLPPTRRRQRHECRRANVWSSCRHFNSLINTSALFAPQQ